MDRVANVHGSVVVGVRSIQATRASAAEKEAGECEDGVANVHLAVRVLVCPDKPLSDGRRRPQGESHEGYEENGCKLGFPVRPQVRKSCFAQGLHDLPPSRIVVAAIFVLWH